MIEKEDRRLIFLDFDGVICDSLPECYAVSRAAFYGLYLKVAAPEPGADDERTFRQLRPYIRRGGDYMFLQLCLQRRLIVGSQKEFDALVSENRSLDDLFHDLFYRARRELFSTDPERWYALNPLYPGMKALLDKHGRDDDTLILSTKEADFISKILSFHGIAWSGSRIYCSGKERKLDYIDRVMDGLGATKAVFVDDQIDHFTGSSAHSARCLLADWGYILPEWLEDGRVETVSLGSLDAVFA
ncbi:MAG: hypothetical protein A2Y38_14795 [Spirochaetes bacterium GWB1_59_5]|nr:MAG: hypothetical protein A2Y38_14795 [Spirochaetes bacterium GWB1_59_5]